MPDVAEELLPGSRMTLSLFVSGFSSLRRRHSLPFSVPGWLLNLFFHSEAYQTLVSSSRCRVLCWVLWRCKHTHTQVLWEGISVPPLSCLNLSVQDSKCKCIYLPELPGWLRSALIFNWSQLRWGRGSSTKAKAHSLHLKGGKAKEWYTKQTAAEGNAAASCFDVSHGPLWRPCMGR